MTVAAAFIFLLFLAAPIALVLGITAITHILASGDLVLFESYPQQLFSALEKYGLLAIPLFMLVGELMNEGGVTTRLIRAARVFVGAYRGGLAYVNLLANMMMASIVGSAAAQIAVMSRVMTPEMTRQGYSPAFAAATTAAGGLLSPIIPPSMLFVIYGVLAQIPIGDMFMAGILPGLLLAFGFMCAIAFVGWRTGFPEGEAIKGKAARQALLQAAPSALVPAIIIGGILGGIATPTESAALAALSAAVLGLFVYRDLKFSALPRLFRETAVTSSVVLFLIAAANVFGWIILHEQIPQNVAAWLNGLTQNPFVFLLLVNILLLGVGAMLDGIAAMIIVVPILLPIAQTSYGIDPFHFGVVISINLVLGLLTPPVGAGLYIAAAASNVKPGDIFRALSPFLVATLVALIILSWQPSIVTALIR